MKLSTSAQNDKSFSRFINTCPGLHPNFASLIINENHEKNDHLNNHSTITDRNDQYKE